MKKKTAGQIINEQTDNKQPDDATPNELAEQMLNTEFESWLNTWIKKGKEGYAGDFFIILNLKLEQSLKNSPHILPELRQTCPDPFYDQSVWHYHRNDDYAEYLWTIPDFVTAKLYHDDPINCPKDERELRDYVLNFFDGTLQKKANAINTSRIRSTNERNKSAGVA